MSCEQPGHFTQRPCGTRLGFSLVGEAIGVRVFLNQAIRPDFNTAQGAGLLIPRSEAWALRPEAC